MSQYVSCALSSVLDIARTYLNDDNKSIWTDAALLPKAQEAHRELQTELWLIGSPIVRAQSAPITVPAHTKTLAALTPADLLLPTDIWEAPTGQTAFIPMTEVYYFPLGVAEASTLVYWAWQNENIVFLGSSVGRDIVIKYRKLLPVPATLNDVIGVLFGEQYMGPRTAAIAAGTVGNTAVYDKLTEVATKNVSKIISANRGQQKSPERP